MNSHYSSYVYIEIISYISNLFDVRQVSVCLHINTCLQIYTCIQIYTLCLQIDTLSLQIGTLCLQIDTCLQISTLWLQTDILCLQIDTLCLQTDKLCVQISTLCLHINTYLDSNQSSQQVFIDFQIFCTIIAHYSLGSVYFFIVWFFRCCFLIVMSFYTIWTILNLKLLNYYINFN